MINILFDKKFLNFGSFFGNRNFGIKITAIKTLRMLNILLLLFYKDKFFWTKIQNFPEILPRNLSTRVHSYGSSPRPLVWREFFHLKMNCYGSIKQKRKKILSEKSHSYWTCQTRVGKDRPTLFKITATAASKRVNTNSRPCKLYCFRRWRYLHKYNIFLHSSLWLSMWLRLFYDFLYLASHFCSP